MQRKGRYYLSRIVKIGKLDKGKFISALRAPATVRIGRYAWTITDVTLSENIPLPKYVYGTLTKFSPEGTVTVIDDQHKSQTNRIEPNLVIAASPFIYVPEFSGIAYLHVWNQIERETFAKRFREIICKTYDNFFVDCAIEPITDLRSFAAKLSSIEAFLEISAKVYPPNPLFGRAWKSLNDYIKKRNADEVNIKEKADESKPLTTQLVQHINGLISQEQGTEYEPKEPVDITDAAILMAADGYGSGKVVGREHNSTIVIRTSETHRSFLFSATPSPSDLFDETYKHLKKITKDRDMRHE
jgi:hypothetical protein